MLGNEGGKGRRRRRRRNFRLTVLRTASLRVAKFGRTDAVTPEQLVEHAPRELSLPGGAIHVASRAREGAAQVSSFHGVEGAAPDLVEGKIEVEGVLATRTLEVDAGVCAGDGGHGLGGLAVEAVGGQVDPIEHRTAAKDDGP